MAWAHYGSARAFAEKRFLTTSTLVSRHWGRSALAKSDPHAKEKIEAISSDGADTPDTGPIETYPHAHVTERELPDFV